MDIQIKPLHNRVLVKLDVNPEMVKSKGGILLPDSVKESPIMLGTVVGVGEGAYENSVWVTPKISIGDRVIFGKYAGANIDEPMGFENYMIVNDKDILAIIYEVEEGEGLESTHVDPGTDYGLKDEDKEESGADDK